MAEKGDWFLVMDTWPNNMPVREPWKYQVNHLMSMWQFWRGRQQAGDVVLEFRNCKPDHDRRGRTARRDKGKGKEKAKPYEEIYDEDADIEDLGQGIGDGEEQELDVDQRSQESVDARVSDMIKIKQEMAEEEERLRIEVKNRPTIFRKTSHDLLVSTHRALYDKWNTKG